MLLWKDGVQEVWKFERVFSRIGCFFRNWNTSCEQRLGIVFFLSRGSLRYVSKWQLLRSKLSCWLLKEFYSKILPCLKIMCSIVCNKEESIHCNENFRTLVFFFQHACRAPDWSSKRGPITRCSHLFPTSSGQVVSYHTKRGRRLKSREQLHFVL